MHTGCEGEAVGRTPKQQPELFAFTVAQSRRKLRVETGDQAVDAGDDGASPSCEAKLEHSPAIGAPMPFAPAGSFQLVDE